MITSEHDSITLMQQQANQSIVEDLHRRGFIDQKARDCVLELLYPHVSWGAFCAQLFMILGCLFIICGLGFYFAFNWENMSGSYKLHTLEAGIVCCAAGAWAFSLSKLQGQLFLITACLLVGAFIGVFSLLYPSGIDNYQLLLLWALLITPWVMISQFVPMWFVWLIILNAAVASFWISSARNNLDAIYFVFFILIMLDSAFLILKELVENKFSWCQARWQRLLFGVSLLALTLTPIIMLIMSGEWKNIYLMLSALLGLAIQCSMLVYYRIKKLDMWMLSATVISLCIICCMTCSELLQALIRTQDLYWICMSITALVIFSLGATMLRLMTPTFIINQDRML